MAKDRLDSRHLERIVKGAANHTRIDVLLLLEQEPELSLDEIAERLKLHMKTISEHVRRLAVSGLVMKRHEGRWVRHALTNRGKRMTAFVKSLE